MSKIQKALEALRDNEANARETRRAADDDDTATKRDSIRQDARRRAPVVKGAGSQLQHIDKEAVEEIEPRHTLNVDRESLVEFGFLSSAADNDVISDQFRKIKRPILQTAFEIDLPVGDNANVIMMASAMPGAGKSFCAFNLAQSIAIERDFGAVLVDADVLKPTISRSLDLQDRPGLIDYLLDPSIDLADILIKTDLHDIIFIPAGRRHPDATELLASRRMQELVAQLSGVFGRRAVIVDTPPLLITNEAQVLAEKVGQIILVIEARVSSQESALRALGMLNHNKPINAILNKSRSAFLEGYSSDDYGYYPYPRKYSGDANSANNN